MRISDWSSDVCSSDLFRGPDGLWEGHRLEDVCTPEAFARDPDLEQTFYDMRRSALAGVEPNPAPHALARLDREWPGALLLVTQHVDISEAHTSELQSLIRISSAFFCLKKTTSLIHLTSIL